MHHLLYKYLILNKRVSVPGIGVFYIDRHPARLDFADKILTSPILQIAFSHVFATTEKSFYSFISTEQNVDEATATRHVADFTNLLKRNLAEEKQLQLPGIGLLTQSEGGELQFQATQSFAQYFPAVMAERIVRPEEEHNILVGDESHTNTEMKELLSEEAATTNPKDYWWVYALILFAVGVTAILYYYHLYGTLR